MAQALVASGRLSANDEMIRLPTQQERDAAVVTGRPGPPPGIWGLDVEDPAEPQRSLVLLSLFDGIGTARIAVEHALQEADLQGKLRTSFFVEKDGSLASAVEKYWQEKARRGQGPPHLRLADDVWDLFRNGMQPLKQALQAVPVGGLLLAIGGFPCKQLSVTGPHRGRLGLAGQDSSLFFIFPALARAAQELRPDVIVHVLAENAGSMLPPNLGVMAQSLGLPVATETAPHIDAGKWTRFGRDRIFLSTLPYVGPYPVEGGHVSAARRTGVPWDNGWGVRYDGQMPTMTTAHPEANPQL